MPNEIKVTINVSDEFLRDIMTNAVESGGLNYWGSIRRVMRDGGLNVLSFQIADGEDLLELNEQAADGEPPAKHEVDAVYETVTKETILKGIQGCLETRNLADDIRTAIHESAVSDDAGDMDAIACDCVVQMGLFEDIAQGVGCQGGEGQERQWLRLTSGCSTAQSPCSSWYARTAKPRMSDFGHSVVKWSTTRWGHDFSFRYTVTCECGKKYSSRTSMSRATDSMVRHRNANLPKE